MLLIGADHGGFKLKERIKKYLSQKNIPFEDVGTNNEESCDYPDFAVSVAKRISEGKAEKGILICGTGIGMSITANKFPGVRATLCHNSFTAKMSREHNNSNILVLGERDIDEETALEITKIWLETPFAGDRHQRRLDKIKAIEEELYKNYNK
ncbi:MAG: ribose 5-phosphate isomerase B [Candidatus Schekmanbacteria bacterium]|nr:MAG: ribose 5-phosphate isomerase B [Candidatus Schekmanbacteria bacterium]